MIEDGVKVETDTSRTLDATSFDAAFADDSEDAGAAPETVAATTPEVESVSPASQDGGAVTAAVEPPAAASPTLPDGYKLDAMGRLHGPDGRVVSKDEAVKILTPATEAPAVAAPAAKPSPFLYRVAGQTKEAEGFLQNEDGSVVVSADKASELRYLLNAKEMLGQESGFVNQVKQENATLKAQVEQYKQGQHADIAKANALVDTYSRMLQEPDDAKAIEAFFQLRQQFPVLLARAEAAHYRTLAEQGKPKPVEAAPQAQATEPPTRETAVETTQDYIERFKIEHSYRDVMPDDWKQFEARTQRTPMAYVRMASPEEVQRGIPSGWVFDDVALRADIDDFAKQLRTVRETAKARTFNAGSQTPTPATPGKPKPRPAAVAATSRGPTFDEAWNAPDDE